MFPLSFVGGSKSASGFGTGGKYPLVDLDRGVHICLRIWPGGFKSSGVQIRKDTGFPGEKSGLKYPQLLQFLLSMNKVNILKDRILIKM